MFSRLVFIALVLFALSGCGTVTIVTAYRHDEKGWNEFFIDQADCNAFSKEYMPQFEWWSIGVDLMGLDPYSATGMHTCLVSHGWQPTVQLTGPLFGDPASLEATLKRCAHETSFAKALNASYLSGESMTNLTRLLRSSDGTLWHETPEFINCLAEEGWQFVYSAPWVTPDTARVASAFVLPPVVSNLPEKFVGAPNAATVRDTSMAVNWPSEAGRFDTAMNWERANLLIKQLNREGFAGRKDWRLPYLDELRSLSNLGAWNLTDPVRILANIGIQGVVPGVYWTASNSGDGGIYAVDITSGNVLKLDKGPPYMGQVLPVAGGGWHASAPEPSTVITADVNISTNPAGQFLH